MYMAAFGHTPFREIGRTQTTVRPYLTVQWWSGDDPDGWCNLLYQKLLSGQEKKSRDGDPASAAMNRSFITLSNAVSVLWAERKPDWNFSYIQVVVLEVVLQLLQDL